LAFPVNPEPAETRLQKFDGVLERTAPGVSHLHEQARHRGRRRPLPVDHFLRLARGQERDVGEVVGGGEFGAVRHRTLPCGFP